MPLTEDQLPVSDLSSDGQDEAFGNAVRPWTPGRDLGHLDAHVHHNRVERTRELAASFTAAFDAVFAGAEFAATDIRIIRTPIREAG